MAISSRTIEQVRARARIDEIVGRYVELANAGADSKKGLCPFHDERTPSFHVRPTKGRWHCFGCGEGGDVIDFISKHEGMEFREAVQWLADLVGVDVETTDERPTPTPAGPSLKRLIDTNLAAAQWMAHQLQHSPEAAPARAFLHHRGIDPATALDWGAGYAPGDPMALSRHLTSQGHTTDEQIEAGLLNPSDHGGHYCPFRARLTWAIKDPSGRIIGFGARRLDNNGPKFLNTRETRLYKKAQALFGIHKARKHIRDQATATIVEGYTDTITAHQAGITTTVAPCGTALTHDQIHTLTTTTGPDGALIIALDGDQAGRKAARRAYDLTTAAGHTRTYIATLPDNTDPNDLYLTQGPTALRTALTTTQPITEHILEATIHDTPLTTDEDRITALHRAAPILNTIHDPALKARYTQRLATMTNLPLTTTRTALAGSGGAVPVRARGAVGDDRAGTLERDVITAIVHDEAVARVAVGTWRLEAGDMETPAGRALLAAVLAALGSDRGTDWATRLETALAENEGRNWAAVLSSCLCAPAPRAGEDLTAALDALIARNRAARASGGGARDLDALAAARAVAVGDRLPR